MSWPTSLKVVNNSDAGDADHAGGNDWDALAAAINAHSVYEPYDYFIFKVSTTYYAKNGTTGKIDYSNTSFYTVLTSVITALSTGGTILLGRGDFSMTTQLVITQNNLKIKGSGIDVTRILYDMASTTTAGFKVTGSIGSDKALTSNALKDQYVAVVASTTGIVADDWVYLARNVVIDPTTSDRYDAELHQVASVTSTDITFYNKIYADYNTSASSRVNKITWVSNFQLEDLTLYENRSSNTDVSEQTDTSFLFCKDLRIRNVKFERMYFCSAQLQNCLDAILEDINCEFPRFLSGGGINYGVRIASASTNITINALHGNKCRHTFTTGILGGSQSTTFGPGRARNITLSNCVSRNANAADFDTHDGAIGVIFNSCGAIAGEPDSGLQTNTKAFDTRSPSIFNGCWTEGAFGICAHVFRGTTGAGSEDAPGGNSVIFNACEFRNTRTETGQDQIGIYLEDIREAVQINNCTFHNITDKPIQIGADSKDITINGNIFTSCSSNNSSSEGIIQCLGNITNLTVSNNNFSAGTAPANSKPLVIAAGTASGLSFTGNNIRALTNKDPFIPVGSTDVIINNNLGLLNLNQALTLPNVSKHGYYDCHSSTVGDGLFSSNITSVIVGTATNAATIDATGFYRTYDTAGTINSIGGTRSTSNWGIRALNIYFKTALYLNSVSNVRIFAGLINSSSNPASSSDPLNAVAGVGLWFDDGVSANWKRMHNDSSGASVVDDTSLVAATSTLYPLEIYAVNDSIFRFAFNNTVTDISSNIPASTTTLSFWIYIENTTGASRTMRMYHVAGRIDK